MRNHIPKIRSLHSTIEKTLFTINPVLGYSRLTDAIDLLARLVHDYDGDNSDIWTIGECSSCTVDSLIIGAYWHYSHWHAGQSSPEYRALSSLGNIFKPGMSCEPERGSTEHDAYLALDALARKSHGMPIYRFHRIWG